MTSQYLSAASLALSSFTLFGCPNVENPDPPGNEQEVITTVALTFTPAGGGAAITAAHDDPENDGAPIVDPITLVQGATYTLAVEFLNALKDPAEDITVEVNEESDQHQVFIYGEAVEGPATGANPAHLVVHAYADEDANGLPVGLTSDVEATATGTAAFRLMLRHMPPENGTAVKDADVAGDFATDGSSALPGDVDADVTFPLTVE